MYKLEGHVYVYAFVLRHTHVSMNHLCLYTCMCLSRPAYTNFCLALPSKWTPERLHVSGNLLAVQLEI